MRILAQQRERMPFRTCARPSLGCGRQAPDAGPVGALALAAVVLVAWSGLFPARAGAAAVSGVAGITRPGSLTPLDSGGSETVYGVALPSGASCPVTPPTRAITSSATWSRKGVSPASVNFKRGRRTRDSATSPTASYYDAINTAEGTGEVVSLPPQFTWIRLTPAGALPQGPEVGHLGGRHRLRQHRRRGDQLLELPDRLHGQHLGSARLHLAGRGPAALGPSHKWLWIGVVLIVLSVALAALAVFLSRRRDQSLGGPPPSADGPTPSPDGTSPSPVIAARAGRGAPEPSVAGR